MVQGEAALSVWRADPAAVSPVDLATAVRYAMEELSTRHPGRSVEVRVPPYAAAQCVAGATHRRGNPPAVVETDPQTWLALSVGELSWGEAVASGRLTFSGERAELSAYLPLFP